MQSFCMVDVEIYGHWFMTAFILHVASHPRNNLFLMGKRPGLIKVDDDIVTLITLPRERLSKKKRKKEREVEKLKIY